MKKRCALCRDWHETHSLLVIAKELGRPFEIDMCAECLGWLTRERIEEPQAEE